MPLTKAELKDAEKLLRHFQIHYAPEEHMEAIDNLIQSIQDRLEEEG